MAAGGAYAARPLWLSGVPARTGGDAQCKAGRRRLEQSGRQRHGVGKHRSMGPIACKVGTQGQAAAMRWWRAWRQEHGEEEEGQREKVRLGWGGSNILMDDV